MIALPRLMRIGAGASGEAAATLNSFDFKKPLIVSDRYLADHGHVDRLVASLAAAGISARVVADTVPDPTTASIIAGVDFLKEGDHDRPSTTRRTASEPTTRPARGKAPPVHRQPAPPPTIKFLLRRLWTR